MTDQPIKRGRGRPPGSTNRNKGFLELEADVARLGPKALKVLEKFMNGDIKGQTPQNYIQAAKQILDLSHNIHAAKARKEAATTTTQDSIQKMPTEGVITPYISTTDPTIN